MILLFACHVNTNLYDVYLLNSYMIFTDWHFYKINIGRIKYHPYKIYRTSHSQWTEKKRQNNVWTFKKTYRSVVLQTLFFNREGFREDAGRPLVDRFETSQRSYFFDHFWFKISKFYLFGFEKMKIKSRDQFWNDFAVWSVLNSRMILDFTSLVNFWSVVV